MENTLFMLHFFVCVCVCCSDERLRPGLRTAFGRRPRLRTAVAGRHRRRPQLGVARPQRRRRRPLPGRFATFSTGDVAGPLELFPLALDRRLASLIGSQ